MDGPSASTLEVHGYVNLGAIGRGSQGAVYTVRHQADSATYVLKRMHIMDPEAVRAALLEAETLQRLQHPAVIGYRDTFVDDEHLCLVMEHGDGGDLATRILNATKPFAEDQVLSWFAQLALALHHVHERGVLHRDLKTCNLFLTQSDQLKIGDFCIAKLLTSHDATAATCAKAKTIFTTCATNSHSHTRTRARTHARTHTHTACIPARRASLNIQTAT